MIASHTLNISSFDTRIHTFFDIAHLEHQGITKCMFYLNLITEIIDMLSNKVTRFSPAYVGLIKSNSNLFLPFNKTLYNTK